MFALLLLLIIVLLVAIFSIQNAAPVIITFFLWRFEASLAIVIFLSVLTGVLIMMIIHSSRAISRRFKQQKTPVPQERPDNKEVQ
ncbi:MAG: LapA family protein [Nitrospirota bacterium]